MAPILFRLSVLLLVFFGCSPKTSYKEALKDPELFHANMRNLTEIIVYDIFSPPVASRIYLYPTIAAYEVIANTHAENISLAGQLTGLTSSPKPLEDINPELSSLYAFNLVAKELVFSEDKMNSFVEKQAKQIKEMGVPLRVRKASRAYAKLISEYILTWANADMYHQTRTFPKYTILEEDQYWKPTPPEYMDGIEPHWNKIRTLVLDSVNQYQPSPPLDFDLTKDSPFQNQLQHVYAIGKSLTEEQVEIAKFWDCNPYVTHHRGHAMFATKKKLLLGAIG